MSVNAPIFVVASSGSGASVLFELLDRARETVRLSPKDTANLREVSLGEQPTRAQAKQLRAIYRHAARATRRVVVSDLGRNALSVRAAHAVWPQARFVYLYRDAAEHIAAQHAPTRAAVAWETSTCRMLNDLVTLPAATWCAVNYADILKDPDGEAQWLGHALGLTWTTAHPARGAVLQRHRAAARLQQSQPPLSGTLSAAVVALAQRAEALQQRHHPAWVAGDLAKARRQSAGGRIQERFQRAVVSSGVAAGVCLVTVLPHATHAATYTVTSLGDQNNTGCLRDALIQANSNSGLDTITFSPNLSGTVTLTSGPLKIVDSVTIQGSAASALAVDGNNSSCVFYPYSNTNLIDVTISNLTIQNGNNARSGGGICSINANLSVVDSVLQNNVSTGPGGGIGVKNTVNNANVNIVNCMVTGNQTLVTNSNSTYAGGGGIALTGAGNVTFQLTGTTVANNTSAGGRGGGIGVYTLPGTATTVEHSAILDNNSAGPTGGFFSNSTRDLVIQNSNISGNISVYWTGGLYATGGGNVSIDASTVSHNLGSFGAGLQCWGSNLFMTASTVSNNKALYACGGGIVFSPRATLVNCTISGNESQSCAGGILARGNLTMESSTVTGNASGVGQTGSYGGGGIFLYGSLYNSTIHNSIVAQNTGSMTPVQISGDGNNTVDISFSLVGDANDVVANSNIRVTTNTNNILGQNPNLGALANNGGATATALPAPDSPVVNAGDPNNPGPNPNDQRGFSRVVQGVIDLGAVELQQCAGTTNLEDEGGCPIGGTAGSTAGTTTAGTTGSGNTTGGTTASTTTGTTAGGTTASTTAGGTAGGGTTGSPRGGEGCAGCATAPDAHNAFVGFVAALAGALRRRGRHR